MKVLTGKKPPRRTANRLPKRAAPLAIAAAVLALPGNARADAPTEQGWWRLTGTNVVDTPAPADVRPGGLLVEGSSTQVTAISALKYEPGAATPVLLTLQLAPSAQQLPTSAVQLCPLKHATFAPSQGGTLASAPAYDCSTSVQGTFDTAHAALSFRVPKQWSVNGTLGLALLPAAAPTRVVLSQPNATSLTVRDEAPTAPAAPPAPGAGTAPGLAPVGSGTTAPTAPLSAGTVPLQATPGSGAATALPVPAPALAPAASTEQASRPVTLAQAPPQVLSSDHASRSRAVALLLLAAAALIGTLWAKAGAAQAGPDHADVRLSQPH